MIKPSETIQTAMTISLIAYVAMVTILPIVSSSGSSSWTLINSLQNLYCYLFIKMNLPSNFFYFLNLFRNSMFILPNISLKFFNWAITEYEWPELPIQTPPEKFNDQELSALFLINGFSIVIYLILSMLLILLIDIMNMILKRRKSKYSGKWSKFKNIMKWNLSIRFLIENYRTLAIGVFLQFSAFYFDDKYSIVSDCLSLALSIFFILFPIACARLISKNRSAKQRQKLKRRYAILFDEYQRRNLSIFRKYFPVILLIRKTLLIGIIVFLYDFPFTNTLLLTLQSFLMGTLLILYGPYKEKKQNLLAIYEEAVFVVINLLLMVIIQHKLETNTIDNIGIVLIAFAGALILVQLVYDFVDELKELKEIGNKIKNFRHARYSR